MRALSALFLLLVGCGADAPAPEQGEDEGCSDAPETAQYEYPGSHGERVETFYLLSCRTEVFPGGTLSCCNYSPAGSADATARSATLCTLDCVQWQRANPPP